MGRAEISRPNVFMSEECLAEECGELFTGLFPCQTFPCHLRPFPSSVFALVAAARAAPLSRCAFAFVSGFREYECDGFVIRRRLAMVDRRFVTGGVTGCDGKCDGSSFRKYLINNICDGVTAQNPGGFRLRRNGYGATRWRDKGITESRKNRKIKRCLSFDCNPLPSNLFEPKRETGVFRIIRNFLQVGYMGGRGVKKG
jgi:hypothetical protein